MLRSCLKFLKSSSFDAQRSACKWQGWCQQPMKIRGTSRHWASGYKRSSLRHKISDLGRLQLTTLLSLLLLRHCNQPRRCSSRRRYLGGPGWRAGMEQRTQQQLEVWRQQKPPCPLPYPSLFRHLRRHLPYIHLRARQVESRRPLGHCSMTTYTF